MYGQGGIGGMGGLGGDGFGAFGAIAWDTVFSRAGYRASTGEWTRPAGWQQKLIEALFNNRASDPPNMETWPKGLDCYGMARSIGLGYDAPAICSRIGPVWAEIQTYIAAKIAAEAAAMWEDATCNDRVVAEGGGSICTAADGTTRVSCYHTDGSEPTILASGPCPPGTGGVPPRFVSKSMVKLRTPTLIPPSGSKTTDKPVVVGRIVGPDGVAIAGALVKFKPPGVVLLMAVKSATTDASGAFSFTTSAGDYELLVSAAGFKDATFAPITVPSGGGTLDLHDLPLEMTMAPAPPTCPEGQVLNPVMGVCEAAPPLPLGCPEGQVPDPETGECKAAVAPSKPWYKTGWGIGLMIAGGAAVLGGGYLLLRGGKKEGT